MPLPPALAARLQKRGLIRTEEPAKPAATEETHVEEVFAEDYDDPNHAPASDNPVPDLPTSAVTPPEVVQQKVEPEAALIHEKRACPNQTNPFHECVDYCMEKWGYKKFAANPSMESRRERMLRKYPIPNSWKEVGDPETGRYFYWNTQTDEVSWLAPLHPHCKVSFPAEKLKELLNAARAPSTDSDSEEEAKEEKEKRGKDRGKKRSAQKELDLDEELSDDDFEELERKVMNEKRQERDRKAEKKSQKKESLDPMDPASYSDTPRGTWTTGLAQKGDAKTGVDATASGPLFQQRPYPSPGAVLRMAKGGGGEGGGKKK